MSETYTDLIYTNFPDGTDDLHTYSDVTASTKDLVNQYYTYKQAGNDAEAANLISTHPELNGVIITHKDFQRLEDRGIAQERFYKSNVLDIIAHAIKNRGQFSSVIQYNEFDIVAYNNQIYWCTGNNVPIGNLPTDTSNWVKISFQGKSGTGMAFHTTWSNETSYAVEDCVPYSNRLYVCIQANYGKQPDISPDYWKSVVFNPKQILYSVNQPENQAEGDIWLEKKDSGNVVVHIKNDALTYDTLYPNNIYKAGISTLHHVNLLASGWQGSTPPFSYNINLVGITSTSLQQILPETNMTDEQENTLIDLDLREGVQSNNVFSILTYREKPAIDIPIRVIIRGDL